MDDIVNQTVEQNVENTEPEVKEYDYNDVPKRWHDNDALKWEELVKKEKFTNDEFKKIIHDYSNHTEKLSEEGFKKYSEKTKKEFEDNYKKQLSETESKYKKQYEKYDRLLKENYEGNEEHLINTSNFMANMLKVEKIAGPDAAIMYLIDQLGVDNFNRVSQNFDDVNMKYRKAMIDLTSDAQAKQMFQEKYNKLEEERRINDEKIKQETLERQRAEFNANLENGIINSKSDVCKFFVNKIKTMSDDEKEFAKELIFNGVGFYARKNINPLENIDSIIEKHVLPGLGYNDDFQNFRNLGNKTTAQPIAQPASTTVNRTIRPNPEIPRVKVR